MSRDLTELYAQRLNRYVTAMRNGKPDCVLRIKVAAGLRGKGSSLRKSANILAIFPPIPARQVCAA